MTQLDRFITATTLKTEHLVEPLGVESRQPRFRWLLEADERGQVQSAYQVLVASTPEILAEDRGDKWDSGRVESDDSVEVVYAGAALASRERSHWKVRVWDRDGREGAYSEPSWFEMGLLDQGEWQGGWIAGAARVSSPLLRREFAVDAPVARARVYVSGVGLYELSLNGAKVGDRVLEPATTYYDNELEIELGTRVLYSTYDVTEQVRQGDNSLGLMLGHGWYSGEADAPLRDAFGDRPCAILQLEVELQDGRQIRVVTDDSWTTSAGPITYNDLSHGEIYDARLEQPGWNAPGFDAAAWTVAEPVTGPRGRLVATTLPPERVTASLPPVETIIPREAYLERSYVYDFGQHFTGWVRIAVSGPAGAKVTLKYGGRMYSDSDTVDNRANESGHAFNSAHQIDTYILKGDGLEIWEPRFTWHGFRYVEVTDSERTPSIEWIEGRLVHSDVEQTGEFSSSNALLDRVHENMRWTFLGSFHGIPQDAAERAERVGWLGDPTFVAEDTIYNYDMTAFWEKWMEDIRDSQAPDGGLPVIAPLHSRMMGTTYTQWPSWHSTYPILPWFMYLYYGDRRVLESHYPQFKKLVAWLGEVAEDDLIPFEECGDHMEPQTNGYTQWISKNTRSGLTATAYYYAQLDVLAKIAEVLGETGDAASYAAAATKVRDAFNRRYLDTATGQYDTGSQTSNALPLFLGMVPEEHVAAVVANLVHDIVHVHDDHVSTGCIGTDAVVQVLPKYGHADLLYKLVTQTTYPSLGHQVTMGATAVGEVYECSPWTSQNMKLLCNWDKFMHRDLAGIQPTSPGYRTALIAPRPAGDLREVTASQLTVRGRISVHWVRARRWYELRVSVPAGIDAQIVYPLDDPAHRITEGGTVVWESGAFVDGVAGLTGARLDGDTVVFDAGSGDYVFELQMDTKY
jgi:alpha-L-rhamnosidase